MDIITLFAKANSPGSSRLVTLLKQTSAAASEGTNASRPEFKLEVTEQAPTADQVQTILDYVGTKRISDVVKGAATADEAMKKFKESAENFQRPVVCLFSCCVWGLFISIGVVDQ